MGQPATSQANSSRAYALARRKAMSGSGKAALKVAATSSTSTGQAPATPARAKPAARTVPAPAAGGSARSASLARRRAMSTQGKTGVASSDRTRSAPGAQGSKPTVESTAKTMANDAAKSCGCGCKDKATQAVESAPAAPKARTSRTRLQRKPKVVIKTDSCRAAALARRKAHSSRGKAGIGKSGMSTAQTARASNPNLSGRELARALREQQSRRGSAGQKKSEPTGRMRPPRKTATGPAQDAPWKVGASDTSHGQTVTGTMVGRSQGVTGDEASTCRDITGTEYLGADIFQQFCQTAPAKAFNRVGQSATGFGNSVTGNQVGRSRKVTGDEPGTCKNVTGTEYVGNGEAHEFCGTPTRERKRTPMEAALTRKEKTVTGDNVGRSDKVTGDESGANRELTGTQYTRAGEGSAPAKVGSSATLRGGSITGSMVGRSGRVTGDEPGSCRNVTGDDYIGQEQFQSFCKTSPERSDEKVGESRTFNGKTVTGTMTGRAQRVTGDEPGTCKTVTGTPYAGAEQYQGYCETGQSNQAAARMQKNRAMAGAPMTGLQPSIGGKMTGDDKGACETVSGTPYVGRDQVAGQCPAVAAEPGSPDFPQLLESAAASDFSVNSPARAVQTQTDPVSSVTGSRYEQGGTITGPFGMASGKVTGTEQARFDRVEQPAVAAAVEKPETINSRPTSRITGEGMDAGTKITGDDWERGDRVTGTEGNSATRRNPTLRGATAGAMPAAQANRNEDMPMPVSRVTGGSGNTDRGALITYSGGARG